MGGEVSRKWSLCVPFSRHGKRLYSLAYSFGVAMELRAFSLGWG